MADLTIRPALKSDAQAVCDIYAFHVAHSTATFDTVAPDAAAASALCGKLKGAGIACQVK